jgi:antitoxin component of MazEF toxin-antitoxin module
MKRMRIRRIGNSNMVALPSELEEAGYRPGVEVFVQEMRAALCRRPASSRERSRCSSA